MASVTQSYRTDGTSYADVIQQMNNAGIRTTGIRQGREADFEDYGNALSSELKHMLMDSFDCEQDYALQNQIAGLFKGRNTNYLQYKDLLAGLRSMGLTVTRESVRTSYISDYKGGNFSNSVRNGSISVFTISDGKGGEIKIADTNGNGAIESEELFMNQILGDVNLDLEGIQPVTAGAVGAGGESWNDAIKTIEKEDEEKASQDEFNKEAEKYLADGYTKTEAELHAGINLGTTAMSYTGTMKSKQEEASQNKYDLMVYARILNGDSPEEAEKYVNDLLGVYTFHYTGIKKNDTHYTYETTDKKEEEKVKEKEENKSVIFNKINKKDLSQKSNSSDLSNSIASSDLIDSSNKLFILSLIKDNEENNINDNIFTKKVNKEVEKAIKEKENFFSEI